MKKILVAFGTRPEAIKMAPLVHALLQEKDAFNVKVCITAQHREMLDQVLDFFDIHPDFDLNLMTINQTLNDLWSKILVRMNIVLTNFIPDIVLVHGDTATSTAVALASFFSRCKVGHVEAGLRTGNKWSPFPEEMNRQLTSKIADFHFAPTEQARRNLLNENITDNQIIVTGNTVIDALFYSIEKIKNGYLNDEIQMLLTSLDFSRDIILVTGHRRENFGQGFVNICEALQMITERDKNVQIVYPLHLNPNVRKTVSRLLSNNPAIHLLSPLSYPAFIWLMQHSKLILTDSGGIQEEAPSLGKPVLIMRENTERPEAIDSGTAVLVGTEKTKIVNETLNLLHNKEYYEYKKTLKNPYGDGNACKIIVDFLKL